MSNGYDRVSGQRGRGKLKYVIAGVAGLMLVACIIGVAVQSSKGGDGKSNQGQGSGQVSQSMKAVQAICQPTDYRETCVNALSAAAGNTTDPKELMRTGFQVATDRIRGAIKNSSVVRELAKDPMAQKAVDVCEALLNSSIDDLQMSFERLGAFDITKLDQYTADLNVWLSGAYTFQESCLDAFENTTGDAGEKMKQILKTSRELTSNAMAMVSQISTIVGSLNVSAIGRRLMSEDTRNGEIPNWVDNRGRMLLAATPANIKPDVIVAKDGSGKYKTIGEALKDVPPKNTKNFVIYIKEGVYAERVLVDKNMANVMMIGDGPKKTIVTGHLNFVDGVQTSATATFTAMGPNFIAKDMAFENTAGAIKHQAVALRVQSDKSIFYNCEMNGYQDTLYTHAHRQFYRDCTISGTIDFIFGDALAVLQNCKMIVRKPMENQQCIVTASGRGERHSASAIVFMNATITGDPEYIPVMDQNPAYLGRPWKNYSRTIIMQSEIDNIIQPQGWLPWAGSLYLNTCFYAEYQNRGPGSDTSKRATWKGVKKISPQHILDFTPKIFFKGDDAWITASGVPYSPGLMKV
ncbi:hypothetical protein CDL15_Pgr011335 [Punica granatum]|uniref:Pectinesterase n=1 Tax=Punica granatum TaxID=22663 RepID=A0A218WFF2_PUNGR|nr:hypothetical protein CDL15_Pgr011335 [Punica granatum]